LDYSGPPTLLLAAAPHKGHRPQTRIHAVENRNGFIVVDSREFAVESNPACMSKRVLCLLGHGFEEIEAVTPVDLLRRAGADVVVASVTGELEVKGRTGLILRADVALTDVSSQPFDLLLIPGGPGVKALRDDGRAAGLARAFADAGKPVAAICAAPTILADAGLLAGKRYTCHFSVNEELAESLSGREVVEDGDLITSRGAGTALVFGLTLVRRLFGEAKAQEVARAIMV
jgi:4-methyl-5(b-hydroxyethyl)-thiazole monophosphate biosynthesis